MARILIVAEVYQDGMLLFTGNSAEIKEKFGFSSKQFANIIDRGKAVTEKGLTPSSGSYYAIKTSTVRSTKKEVRKKKTLFKDVVIPGETIEHQRLRRRITREIARERGKQ